MIETMLQEGNISIVEKVGSWQEAIHVCLEPLVRGGYVTDNYEKAIIKATGEYGPYYVMVEDVALIHGRPTDGVLEKQLALTVLKEPIVFETDGLPVRLLFALAATDSDSHLDVMKVLTEVLMDEKKVKDLAECGDTKQIYRMLLQIEQETREAAQ